jgi:hypothetical protein
MGIAINCVPGRVPIQPTPSAAGRDGRHDGADVLDAVGVHRPPSTFLVLNPCSGSTRGRIGSLVGIPMKPPTPPAPPNRTCSAAAAAVLYICADTKCISAPYTRKINCNIYPTDGCGVRVPPPQKKKKKRAAPRRAQGLSFERRGQVGGEARRVHRRKLAHTSTTRSEFFGAAVPERIGLFHSKLPKSGANISFSRGYFELAPTEGVILLHASPFFLEIPCVEACRERSPSSGAALHCAQRNPAPRWSTMALTIVRESIRDARLQISAPCSGAEWKAPIFSGRVAPISPNAS